MTPHPTFPSRMARGMPVPRTNDRSASISSPSTNVAVTGQSPAMAPRSPLDSDESEVLFSADNLSEHASDLDSIDNNPERKSPAGIIAYVTTKRFYLTLALGQILALANTATSTFTTLLAKEGISIPALQTFFNYTLLNLVFTSYTIYRYGIKRWLWLITQDGWKYIILAFCDVEGNYFIVLAYRYTTILSAQLINFWAIAVVVIISCVLLGVRYHATQVTGILVCVIGMLVLLVSDQITGVNIDTGSNGDTRHDSQGSLMSPSALFLSSSPSSPSASSDHLKGDLFALLGATFYGLTNTAEEYLVSKRPVYEVLGQMTLFAMLISGTQAFILESASFTFATWNGPAIAYMAGYTVCLSSFYATVPLMLRLSSATFFNISLLTMNFWGVVVGIKVFHLRIDYGRDQSARRENRGLEGMKTAAEDLFIAKEDRRRRISSRSRHDDGDLSRRSCQHGHSA